MSIPINAAEISDRDLDRLVRSIHRDPENEDACWTWAPWGKVYRGRPATMINGRRIGVCRVLYALEYGVDPGDLDVEHLCARGHLGCVSPKHLALLTKAENSLAPTSRSIAAVNARKTHCSRGHLLAGYNVVPVKSKNGRIGRKCRTCQLMAQRASYRGEHLKRMPYVPSIEIQREDLCLRGHDMAEGSPNVRIRSTGQRVCRACENLRKAQARAAR